MNDHDSKPISNDSKQTQPELTEAKQYTDLLRDWDRWVATMRRIEKRRSPRISKRRYRNVHHRLLQRCQTKADHQVLHDSIFAIAAPWVSLDAISQADRRVLQEILIECDQLNHTIRSIGFRIAKKTRELVPLISFLSMLAVATIQFNQISHTAYIWTALLRRRFTYVLSELNTEQSLAILTVFVVIGGVWLTRQTRSF